MSTTIQSLSRKPSSLRTRKFTGVVRPSHVIRSATALVVLWSCLLLWQKASTSTTTEERRHLSQAALYDSTIHNYPSSSSSTTTRHLGILVGIFTADLKNDREYRSRHRKLFTLWNDPRVCSLSDFEISAPTKRAACEVIYTFVVGGANPQDSPSEWMEQDDTDMGKRPDNPILVPPSIPSNFTASDLSKRDVTRLNIRENMNEGKSQTWFKYAYQVMQDYPEISYTMKLDADSILHLHEFFHFAYRHLPPPPFSDNAYVGALRDKAYWPMKKDLATKDREALEGFFGTEFEGVHLYLAGQCYILSANLARVIQKESKVVHEKRKKTDTKLLMSNNKRNHTTYLEGHEDHDIAAMVFHSAEPVHMITVGRKQRFWEHPVKGEPRWRRIWHREVARMEGRPFDGKLYTTESSFEEVMGFQIGVAD